MHAVTFTCARKAMSLPIRHLSHNLTKGRQVARFSQCTARLRNDVQPQHDKVEKQGRDVPPKQEEQTENGGQSQSRGRKLPAFVLFAVGAPLGWYLNDLRGAQHNSRVSRPGEFVKYTLVGKDNVSSTCAIFKLKPAGNVVVDLDDPSLERAITSIEFKQPQLQIARSYTCLPQEQGQDMDELRFLIRKEQKGEVSSFLHRLPLNAEIEIRGLKSEYVLPEDVASAIFLVGGTGIAPALQAADKLDGQANMHIMWASRRREDCIGGYNDSLPTKRAWGWWQGSTEAERNMAKFPIAEQGGLVSLLESLKRRSGDDEEKHPKLIVDYYVDEEGTAVKAEEVKNALHALSGSPTTGESSGRKILFVSGPPGFITYWAGSKQWAGGREVPGPLRGVLSTIDLRGWEVVKL
ncbi:uncharacterized protein RCC_04632 [Ramularia collo-cygni]|uniref:Flavoprotein pyridine nucleotide cytochrome reductase-like FAD-binding domain-containing protein n=1 Tax=Ramularia collo-cygni TaxID=112498 RepID=A0A2D3UUF0_9PEZI|nr:uncharacterized protein RCC_04632 [Ramularia collo-cygni]CZT18788.1 uncharacterized protein RCC_04632 [Ramularia collo-cygni]